MKRIIFQILCISVLIAILNPSYALSSDNFQQTFELIDQKIINAGEKFGETVEKYATALFWTLATISLAWTAIEMGIKQAEFGEIASELCKFIVVTGIFYWFLQHGPEYGKAIVDSLTQIASISSGNSNSTSVNTTSFIVKGIVCADKLLDMIPSLGFSLDSFLKAVLILITALVYIIIFILIAIKYFIIRITLLCQLYAGCFFLGFGGSRWTRDTTVNYFKSVIANSAQFFTLIFLLHILSNTTNHVFTFLKPLEQKDTFDTISFSAIFALILLPVAFKFLSDTLPSTIAGLISSNFSSSPTSSGITRGGMVAVGTAAAGAGAVAAYAGMATGGTMNALDKIKERIGASEGTTGGTSGKMPVPPEPDTNVIPDQSTGNGSKMSEEYKALKARKEGENSGSGSDSSGSNSSSSSTATKGSNYVTGNIKSASSSVDGASSSSSERNTDSSLENSSDNSNSEGVSAESESTSTRNSDSSTSVNSKSSHSEGNSGSKNLPNSSGVSSSESSSNNGTKSQSTESDSGPTGAGDNSNSGESSSGAESTNTGNSDSSRSVNSETSTNSESSSENTPTGSSESTKHSALQKAMGAVKTVGSVAGKTAIIAGKVVGTTGKITGKVLAHAPIGKEFAAGYSAVRRDKQAIAVQKYKEHLEQLASAKENENGESK